MVLEYDLASNRWTSKKPVPFSGDHMAAAESGGKIYVFGGQAEGGANKPLNTAWEYDPAADSWKALAPMPSSRTAAVAVTSGGKIYVIGGNTDAGLNVGSNDVYDPATNRWESRRPMPTARNHAAAARSAARFTSSAGASPLPTSAASYRATPTLSRSTTPRRTRGAP